MCCRTIGSLGIVANTTVSSVALNDDQLAPPTVTAAIRCLGKLGDRRRSLIPPGGGTNVVGKVMFALMVESAVASMVRERRP